MIARAALPAPKRLGRYAIGHQLGKGGMASVYLGRAEGPGGFAKKVAIKVLYANYAADSELIGQFIEEAKIAALIQHANVVSVHEVGEDDGQVFLVMDYVDGASLAALTRAARERGTPLPLPVFMRILCDALAGLHAAHELRDESGMALGVVHRDFSPQNILVGVSGVARLTDFGVAKVLTSPGRTRSGVIKGKVRYMSPEQVRGDAVDRRCDVWAAGVILWETLSGRRLYGKKDDVATLVEIATKPPPPLSSVCSGIPAELEAVVMSALTRSLDARCPDAETLRLGLLRAVAGYTGVADVSAVAAAVRALSPASNEPDGVSAASEPTYSPPPRAAATMPETADTDTISLETLSREAGRRSRRARGAWLLAGLSVAVVSGAWVLTPQIDGADGVEAVVAVQPPAAEQVSAAPTLSAAPSRAAPVARPVAISANAAISELTIDGRKHALEKPATLHRLELANSDAEIEARSTDGRTASYSGPVADVIELEFPARPRGPARRPLASKPPAKAPQKSPNPDSLPPSPY